MAALADCYFNYTSSISFFHNVFAQLRSKTFNTEKGFLDPLNDIITLRSVSIQSSLKQSNCGNNYCNFLLYKNALFSLLTVTLQIRIGFVEATVGCK